MMDFPIRDGDYPVRKLLAYEEGPLTSSPKKNNFEFWAIKTILNNFSLPACVYHYDDCQKVIYPDPSKNQAAMAQVTPGYSSHRGF